MCRIPYNRIIFQQWTNISYESFTNKIEPSRIEPSEKDADTLKSFSYYSTDVKFEINPLVEPEALKFILKLTYTSDTAERANADKNNILLLHLNT